MNVNDARLCILHTWSDFEILAALNRVKGSVRIVNLSYMERRKVVSELIGKFQLRGALPLIVL